MVSLAKPSKFLSLFSPFAFYGKVCQRLALFVCLLINLSASLKFLKGFLRFFLILERFPASSALNAVAGIADKLLDIFRRIAQKKANLVRKFPSLRKAEDQLNQTIIGIYAGIAPVFQDFFSQGMVKVPFQILGPVEIKKGPAVFLFYGHGPQSFSAQPFIKSPNFPAGFLLAGGLKGKKVPGL